MNDILFFKLLDENVGLAQRICDITGMNRGNFTTMKKKGGKSMFTIGKMIRLCEALNQVLGSSYTIQELFFDKV